MRYHIRDRWSRQLRSWAGFLFMSKDPAFLFYPADASEDTQFMNRLERGAYFDLVKSQRIFHGYSTEQLRKVLGKDFDSVFPALEMILKQDEAGYYVGWVRESLSKRAEFQAKQKEKIENYWNKKREKKKIPRNNHGITTVIPMVNGNENENGKINESDNVIDFTKKQKFAEFVTMTGIEHGKLVDEFGEELTAKFIDKLNTYKGANGKKYKSDYMAIRQWVVDAVTKDRTNGKQTIGQRLNGLNDTIDRIAEKAQGGR